MISCVYEMNENIQKGRKERKEKRKEGKNIITEKLPINFLILF